MREHAEIGARKTSAKIPAGKTFLLVDQYRAPSRVVAHDYLHRQRLLNDGGEFLTSHQKPPVADPHKNRTVRIGYRGPETAPAAPKPGWTDTTAHLGVRFALAFKGAGLRVRDVLPESPAAREGSRIKRGEIITHIDGQKIGPDTDLAKLLTGRLDFPVGFSLRKVPSLNEWPSIPALVNYAYRDRPQGKMPPVVILPEPSVNEAAKVRPGQYGFS